MGDVPSPLREREEREGGRERERRGERETCVPLSTVFERKKVVLIFTSSFLIFVIFKYINVLFIEYYSNISVSVFYQTKYQFPH